MDVNPIPRDSSRFLCAELLVMHPACAGKRERKRDGCRRGETALVFPKAGVPWSTESALTHGRATVVADECS